MPPHKTNIVNIIQDRVLIVQGGYVSQSQGQQLSVTKKSNVLDKPKPNALNSKKQSNHDQSNNNNTSTDINDSATSRYESRSSPAPVAAVPEVTVSSNYASVNRFFLQRRILLKAADLKAIQDEIRKLKAVIVKHENRIRALEAQAKARDEENNIKEEKESPAETTTSPSKRLSQLGPDEV